MDREGGFAAGAHGQDDRRAAGDNVAAGKDAGLGSAHGLGVGNNIVALVGLEVGRGALDEGIGGGADADDDTLAGRMYSEPAMGMGLRRPSASGSPSSMRTQRAPVSQPFSSPMNSTGLVNMRNSMPSSWAWCTSSRRAGISACERR